MPATITFSDRIIDPATLRGVAVTSLTIEIYNLKMLLLATLVFPTGIQEIINAGPDYVYQVNAFNVADTVQFPGDFMWAKWIPAVAAGNVAPWEQLLQIRNTASPTVAADRTPYTTTIEADAFFQTRMDYEDWNRFMADPVMVLRALITASDNIDREKYKGQKIRLFDNSYMRQFPRLLPYNEAVASFFNNFDTIPKQVRMACAVQALYLMKQRERGHDWEARMDLQLKGLTGVNRGEHTESYDLTMATQSPLCSEARQLLHPFLAQGIDNMPTYF